MTQRTIIIGDIHGCYDEVLDLLAAVGCGADDRVISVGDLIVKGPKNREVLDLFRGDERFSAVLGNHERAVLEYWQGRRSWLKPSQEKCRAELEDARGGEYLAYLATLPLVIDLESHIVVHAGVRPGVALAEQTIDDLTELRTLGADRTSREGVAWYEVYDGEATVLFGHWPAPAPRCAPRALGLDTGCVYGQRLSAYILETGELMSVPARRVYNQPRARSG